MNMWFLQLISDHAYMSCRIDLLRVLREEVAPHPALDARLALCERSPDAPPWWQPARHDKLLVHGVCKSVYNSSTLRLLNLY